MTSRFCICVGSIALIVAGCAGSSGSSPVRDADGSTSGAPGSSGSKPPSGMEGLVEAHNRHRADHCAPPLSWSEDLARVAQSWADELSRRGCAFEHSSSGYGENLAAGTEGTVGPERAVEIWYEEKKSYTGKFSMKAGHFTQLVWVGSQRLGCGTTTCKGQQIWVCNYDPPGNMQGQFESNVRPTCTKNESKKK